MSKFAQVGFSFLGLRLDRAFVGVTGPNFKIWAVSCFADAVCVALLSSSTVSIVSLVNRSQRAIQRGSNVH